MGAAQGRVQIACACGCLPSCCVSALRLAPSHLRQRRFSRALARPQRRQRVSYGLLVARWHAVRRVGVVDDEQGVLGRKREPREQEREHWHSVDMDQRLGARVALAAEA